MNTLPTSAATTAAQWTFLSAAQARDVPTITGVMESVRVRGRDAIEADYRNQLAGAPARSGRHHIHPPDSIRAMFITPDVALIDVASVNVGGTDAAGTPLANSQATPLVTIWRKRAGEWLVVYQRALPPTPTPR